MKQLADTDPMPYAVNSRANMEEVPAKRLFWLWTQPDFNKESLIGDYIRRNLAALAKEYPNGIW